MEAYELEVYPIVLMWIKSQICQLKQRLKVKCLDAARFEAIIHWITTFILSVYFWEKSKAVPPLERYF